MDSVPYVAQHVLPFGPIVAFTNTKKYLIKLKFIKIKFIKLTLNELAYHSKHH